MFCCKDCGEYSYTRQWKSETFCAPHTFFQQVSYITTDGIIWLYCYNKSTGCSLSYAIKKTHFSGRKKNLTELKIKYVKF